MCSASCMANSEVVCQDDDILCWVNTLLIVNNAGCIVATYRPPGLVLVQEPGRLVKLLAVASREEREDIRRWEFPGQLNTVV